LEELVSVEVYGLVVILTLVVAYIKTGHYFLEAAVVVVVVAVLVEQ